MSIEDEWAAATPVTPRKKAKPIDEAGPGETFLRKASNAVSSGFVNPISARITSAISGQPYQDALKGINESDAQAAEDNPKAALAGTVTGTGLQLAAPLPKLGAGASLGARALHSGAVGAGFGAASGAGEALSEGGGAAEALGGAARGAAVGGATGAAPGYGVGKLFRGAPERVDARTIRDIARGEAGGKGAKKLTDKVAELAEKPGGAGARAAVPEAITGAPVAPVGAPVPEGEGANQVLEALDAAGARKLAHNASGHSPAKVEKAIQEALDRNQEKTLGPIYEAVDAGPANPQAVAVKVGLSDLAEKMRGEGNAQAASHVDSYVRFLDGQYPDGKTMTASMLRKVRNEVGTGNAFPSDEIARSAPGVQAKQAIYHGINAAIEDAAAGTPGVDVATLRAGNRHASTLIPVVQTLADRAAKQKQGAGLLTHAIAGGIGASEIAHIAAGGMSTGNIAKAAAEIASVYAARHAIPAVGRAAKAADYGIAEIERAARKGGANAKLVRAIGEAIAARAGGEMVRAKMNDAEPQ